MAENVQLGDVILGSYQSKSKRLTSVLRLDIEKGNYSLFPHLPSEVRLAELYGAARATVRKALKELMDDGVLERHSRQLQIAPEFRRSPGAVPVAEPMFKRHKIGGIFAQEDSLISGLISGISKAAEVQNVDFQYFLRIPRDPELWVTELAACGFDGLLLMPLELEPYRRLYEAICQTGMPVVCLDRCLFGYEDNCACVEADNRAGAYRAVARLIMLYQRPVHFFCYPLDDSTSAVERYDGFCNAMRDAGLQQETEACSHFFSFIDLTKYPEQERLSGALRELRKLTPPVSIFTLNDYAAYAVYMACATLKWQIGKDVKIISFDDSPLAYRLQPRLSGLRQPLEEIGRASVELLRRMIAGEVSQPMQIKVPVTLVEKESSLPDAAEEIFEFSNRKLKFNGIYN